MQNPRVALPIMEQKLLTLQGNSIFLRSSQLWVPVPGVGFLARAYLCLSYPSQCHPFTICCRGTIHLVFRTFSDEIILYVVVEFLCCEVYSASSYTAILNLLDSIWWVLNIALTKTTTKIQEIIIIPISALMFLPRHSPSPSPPRKPLFWFSSQQISFAYSRTSHKWNCTICTLM